MLSQKGIIRLSATFAFIFWVLLTIVDILAMFAQQNQMAFGIPSFVGNALVALFAVSLIIFYKYNIGKAESVNFVDLLWRVFVTGLITTVVSLIIDFFFKAFGANRLGQNPLIINFLYHVNVAMIMAFVISTFVVWKRLILYQKSKSLMRAWQLYEYCIIGSLVYDLF